MHFIYQSEGCYERCRRRQGNHYGSKGLIVRLPWLFYKLRSCYAFLRRLSTAACCVCNIIFIKNKKPDFPSPCFRVLCGLLYALCVYYFSQDRAICNCRETSTHPLCPAIGQCHGACCTHCMAYLRRSVPSFNFNFSFMWER
jgi:hypothetical protein